MQDSGASVRWLPLGQACRVLGVSPATLRQWADQGLVRAFRTPGGHRRFAHDDLEALRQGATARTLSSRPPQVLLKEGALRRIRQRLHGEQAQASPWYGRLDEGVRGRLRLFGRRLLDVAQAYLEPSRRRAQLLEEVRLIGQEYGEELARQGLSLPEVLAAFIFFRRSLLASARPPASDPPGSDYRASHVTHHVEAVADELLMAMAQAYERRRYHAPSGAS